MRPGSAIAFIVRRTFESWKTRRRLAVFVALAVACPLIILRQRGSPTQQAINQLRLEDTRLRRAYSSLWNVVPRVITDQFPTLEPVLLDKAHLLAVHELSWAPVSSAAVTALVERLRATKSSAVQAAIILAFHEIGPAAKDAIEPLLEFQRMNPGTGAGIELGVFYALSAIDPSDAQVTSALLAALEDNHQAPEAIGVFHRDAEKFDDAVRDRLIEIFDDFPQHRASLATVIPRMIDNFDDRLLFILSGLRDPDSQVKDYAARTVTENLAGAPEIIAELRNILVDFVDRAAMAKGKDRLLGRMIGIPPLGSIDALGKAGHLGWEVGPLLGQCYDALDPFLKTEVATAWWRTTGRDDALVAEMGRGLRGPEEFDRRQHYLYRLARLTPEWAGAEPFWLEFLNHHDGFYRKYAVFHLGRLGNSAAFALPLIRERLNDPSESVRVAAAEAVQKIEASSKTAQVEPAVDVQHLARAKR